MITSAALGTQERVVVKTKVGKTQGYLGVSLLDVTSKLVKRENLAVNKGAYVVKVVDDGPADKAGVKEGDVIVKYGEVEIDDSDDLREEVRKTKPKTEVKIELYRKSDKKTLTVKIGRLRQTIPDAYFYEKSLEDYTSMIPKIHELDDISSMSINMFASSRKLPGLKMQNITKQLGEYFGTPNKRGVLVTEVKRESEAAKAGFKAGDVIINVQDESVDNTEELMDALKGIKKGQVNIVVIRNGKPTTLKMEYDLEDDCDDRD